MFQQNDKDIAKLSIKTQGVKGGNPQYKERLGYASTFVDNSENVIIVDGFDGVGENYQERVNSKITFQKGNRMIQFDSFDDLFNLLEKTIE